MMKIKLCTVALISIILLNVFHTISFSLVGFEEQTCSKTILVCVHLYIYIHLYIMYDTIQSSKQM